MLLANERSEWETESLNWCLLVLLDGNPTTGIDPCSSAGERKRGAVAAPLPTAKQISGGRIQLAPLAASKAGTENTQPQKSQRSRLGHPLDKEDLSCSSKSHQR